MKSGNLNFLEPFGPLQACNWTALPLNLYMHKYTHIRYISTHIYIKREREREVVRVGQVIIEKKKCTKIL
jgi:hypothetical protein